MVVPHLSNSPEIGYMPDRDRYLARRQQRQATENLDKKLLEGFPSQLTGSLVWNPENLTNTYDWNYHLTTADLEEINAALRHFQGMIVFEVN